MERFIVVIVRVDGTEEPLSHSMEESFEKCKRYADWCQRHYLGVDVVIAKCVIDVKPAHILPPPPKAGAKREVRKPAPKQPTLFAPDGWSLWIDANKAAKRFEPIPSGPDVETSKRLWVALKHDTKALLKVYAAYLNDPEPFVMSKGFALRHIEAKVNKYLNDAVVDESSIVESTLDRLVPPKKRTEEEWQQLLGQQP